MANPTGHTYHHSQHQPGEAGGPGVVHRSGPVTTTPEHMRSPQRLNRPAWYPRYPRLAKNLEDAGQLYQRYPWGFFVLGMVAGGLIGCCGRKVL